MATRPLHILTVIGARPQIIKAAALGRAIAGPYAGRIKETLLHTGQHYDANMSQVFLEELGMRPPDVQLNVGSGSHGQQTARMLEGIEQALLTHRPDVLLVYGDTNSTLAGALAAAKLRIPVAHVESGLRSFDRAMPEEVNRVLCDHCSTWLFCPTERAVDNLRREGMDHARHGRPSAERPVVVLSGDVMYDNSLHFAAMARRHSSILLRQGLSPDKYVLATVHRDHNTDDPQRLGAILGALIDVSRMHGLPVVLPLHPRTRSRLADLSAELVQALEGEHGPRLIDPVGFLDMIALEDNARLVITDSGGVQKEAGFFGKGCVVLRNTTEWVELVEHGLAELVDADPQKVMEATRRFLSGGELPRPSLYGDGHAAERICEVLLA